MYIDHEISPFYWEPEPRTVANLFKFVYLHLSPPFNSLYFRLKGLNLPPLDYSLSDYWYAKKHSLNHTKIKNAFKEENYQHFERQDYHLRRGYFLNPLFRLYVYFCRPETSLWLAKKQHHFLKFFLQFYKKGYWIAECVAKFRHVSPFLWPMLSPVTLKMNKYSFSCLCFSSS